MAKRARPETYSTRKIVQANYAALTMRYGGVVIALFLLFHLAQLTWGLKAVNSGYIQGDPYGNLLYVFASPIVTLLYMIALTVLGFHLFHGAWSLFQTLGLNGRKLDKYIKVFAWIIAIGVPVGFATVPIAIQLGIVN